MAVDRRTELINAFGASLGREKAAEIVDEVAREFGQDPSNLTYEDMLRVLDTMTEIPGLVGVTSRFVKMRFILREAKQNIND